MSFTQQFQHDVNTLNEFKHLGVGLIRNSLSASAWWEVYPHLAPQNHDLPSGTRGIVVLLVDKFRVCGSKQRVIVDPASRQYVFIYPYVSETVMHGMDTWLGDFWVICI